MIQVAPPAVSTVDRRHPQICLLACLDCNDLVAKSKEFRVVCGKDATELVRRVYDSAADHRFVNGNVFDVIRTYGEEVFGQYDEVG